MYGSDMSECKLMFLKDYIRGSIVTTVGKIHVDEQSNLYTEFFKFLKLLGSKRRARTWWVNICRNGTGFTMLER